jgi:hypothetical protein
MKSYVASTTSPRLIDLCLSCPDSCYRTNTQRSDLPLLCRPRQYRAYTYRDLLPAHREGDRDEDDGGNKNGACLGLSSGRLHIKPSAPGIPKPTRDKLRVAPASLGWRSTHRDVGQGDARSHPSIKMSKNSRRLNGRSESKTFKITAIWCDLVRCGPNRKGSWPTKAESGTTWK